MKPFARMILVSSLALAGVVTTYIILKRRRKRRDAECASKTRPQDVQPLRDDVREKISPRRFKWQRSVEARKQAAHDGLTARKTFLSAALPESERSAVPRNRNEYADDVCALKSVLLNCDKADY